MGTLKPLEATVRPKESSLVLRFAEELLPLFEGSDGITASASAEGLVLSCIWEPDLDLANDRIQQAFVGPLMWSKPRIRYIRDGRLLEPILFVHVRTPDDFMGSVVGDLSQRRGTITGFDDAPEGKPIHAHVPLAELSGYQTSLQKPTNGCGIAAAELHSYEAAPQGTDPDEPVSVALSSAPSNRAVENGAPRASLARASHCRR